MLLVVKGENKSLCILLLCFPQTSLPPTNLTVAFSQTLPILLLLINSIAWLFNIILALLLRPHHLLPHAACPVESTRYHVVCGICSSELCPSSLVIIMCENESNFCCCWFFGRFFFLKCSLERN